MLLLLLLLFLLLFFFFSKTHPCFYGGILGPHISFVHLKISIDRQTYCFECSTSQLYRSTLNVLHYSYEYCHAFFKVELPDRIC